MAFNGSGTFVRVHSWTSDAAGNINITASRMDAEDDGFATGLTACLTRNGENSPSADLPMGGFAHTGVALSGARTEYARTDQVQDSLFTYAADTGSADAYAIALSPTVTAYVAGQRFTFIAGNTNTGASTLSVNGVGTQAIQTWYGAALPAGAITSGQPVDVIYDGTNFLMLAGQTSADIDAIIGLTSAANKMIRYTGSGTADLVDFLDEDTMVSDSATAVASQQSVKAYARCNPIREDSTTETVPASVHGQITEAALTSSITKTLPDITTVPDGAQYGFRIKSTTGAYTLSIVPTGSDNIDVDNVAGHDSFVLADAGDFVMLIADVSDTAWKITVDKCAGPHFRASRINSAQSLGSGSFVKAQYNTEDSDIWGHYDPTTNYRHTPLIPGLYEYKCAAFTATDTSGRIAVMIYKNGTLHEYGSRTYTTNDGVNVGCWEVEMNGSTDYVEIYVRSLDDAGDFGGAATIESYFKGRRKTLG